MEITPYQSPILTWNDFGPGMVSALVVGILLCSVAFGLYKKHNIAGVMLFLVGASLTIFSGATFDAKMRILEIENYTSYTTKFVTDLRAEGFEVISGMPPTLTDKKSEIVLSYGGQQFDCTSFMPSGSETSFVFSCGESQLSLADVKDTFKK